MGFGEGGEGDGDGDEEEEGEGGGGEVHFWGGFGCVCGRLCGGCVGSRGMEL